MFNKMRVQFQEVSQEIMGRIINITIPLQQIIISVKDLISKIQGSLTAGLFTLLGSYYALRSFLGVVAQFIVSILISLAATIAVLWAVPITWGAAAANTAIFVAISIPMIVILAFMVDVLHIKTNLKIPKVKCFDKNTLIKMNDETEKKIIDIQVGDILSGNNEVTACFKLVTRGSIMHKLGNVIVSDSHVVNYNGNWIHVSEHPDAIKYIYNEPFLYCLNTSSKEIVINNYVFTDWDEIYGSTLDKIIQYIPENSTEIFDEQKDFQVYIEINGKNEVINCHKSMTMSQLVEQVSSVLSIPWFDVHLTLNGHPLNGGAQCNV
jgi:hypothetical protein